MSVWDWVHEFASTAQATGDEERMRLVDLQQQAFQHGKANPELMLAALEEGRALAQRLDEPWWVLLFDHWRLQCYMHYLLDYRPATELAVRATLEARKPPYAQLPQRICLHDDLINTYLGVDPLGHADAIRKALDFMEREVSEDVECRYCLQNRRRDFALERDRLEEAEECSRQQLAMAEGDFSSSTGDHHSVFACSGLCEVALRREDWESLREWAEVGEGLARRVQDHLYLATFLLLQALLARRDGDQKQAASLYRQGLGRRDRVQALPGFFYYDALCAYHEAGGQPDKALQARLQQLSETSGKGRLHDECKCRVKVCRLLAQLGRPVEEGLAAAREAARQLRNPQPFLDQLDEIERGEWGA
jgi:hypothetical protein